MLQLCSQFCKENCLTINDGKTKTMMFGWNHSKPVEPLSLNNSQIEMVTYWKYLGTTVVAGNHLSFSATGDIRTFYCAFNSIFSVTNGFDECVLLKLLYTNCVSIIICDIGVKRYSGTQKMCCNTAVNHAIRKIFTLQRYQSIRFLRENSNFKSLTELIAITKRKFETSLHLIPNNVIKYLLRINVI